MRRLFPDLDVVHLDAVLPQQPEDSPDFWPLWLAEIRRHTGESVDVVFTSEDYGEELARRLGARHMVADRGRQAVPVSGTAIRADPYAHWRDLPDVVRPYYCRRVVVFGPESTGKTTLAKNLAGHFNTVWVPEYARGHLDPKGGKCVAADIPLIAAGQAASEDALAEQANRVLICDTDLLTTTIWSDVYFGDCPAWICAEAKNRRYDLHLFCDIDVPWVDDRQRDMPHRRAEFRDRCQAALVAHGATVVRISGSWDERLRPAITVVELLLGPLLSAPPIAARARVVADMESGIYQEKSAITPPGTAP